MAGNPELESLRAQARSRHRAATRKISRLLNVHGAEISGTKVDPRRDLAAIKRYNSVQLKAYIRELNAFTSRTTQFVSDAQGRPVASSLWAQYKSLEAQYNARVNREFDTVKDVYMPRWGMTVGERMAATTPDHRQMGSPAVNAPYAPPTRRPSNVASERALKRLIRDLETRLKPNWRNNQISEGRKQFEQLSSIVGDDKLLKAVRGLTNEQFSLLWNFTPFATAASFVYEVAKAHLSGKQRAFHTDAMQQFSKDTHALVEWVSTVNLGG